MPHYCVAYGCYNKQGLCEYSFHRFPADPFRHKQWEAAVKCKGWSSTEYSQICGTHFVKSMDRYEAMPTVPGHYENDIG